jgi:hypothetical protein
MLYPYNAIFGRGLLNTIEVVSHMGYLCLKILETFGLYPSLAGNMMPETSRRGLHQVTKTYISCEKSQSNTTPSPLITKHKLQQNAIKQ